MRYKIKGIPVRNETRKPRGNFRDESEIRKHQDITYELPLSFLNFS